MTLPRGDDDWFLRADDDTDGDADDDRRSTFALVIGSLGALVVAGAMTLAIVFAFGEDGDEPSALVPQPSAPASGSAQATAAATPQSTPSVQAPTPSPTSAPTSSVGTDEPLMRFVSPSGNIACMITASRAECHIAAYEYDPPEPGECPATWGDALAVTEGGSEWVCHDDSFQPAGEPLPYGSGAGAVDFTCLSAENGMTCTHDPSGASFRISRADVELTGQRER